MLLHVSIVLPRVPSCSSFMQWGAEPSDTRAALSVSRSSEQSQEWDLSIQEFIKTTWGQKLVLDPWHFPTWMESQFILAGCCSQAGYRASHIWVHFWERWNGVGTNKSLVFPSEKSLWKHPIPRSSHLWVLIREKQMHLESGPVPYQLLQWISENINFRCLHNFILHSPTAYSEYTYRWVLNFMWTQLMSSCSQYACLVANAEIKLHSISPEIQHKFFKGGTFFCIKLLGTLRKMRSITLIKNH